MKLLHILAAATSLLSISAGAAPTDAGEVFEAELAAFEREDATEPAAPGGLLVLGSSSIKFWVSLEEDLAPLKAVNRGFGGSRIADINRNFARLLGPHRPSAILLYSGDNDLVSASPEAVFSELGRFLDLKTRHLGDVPVYVLTVKPSPARVALLPRQRRYNALLAALAERRPDVDMVDIFSSMVGPDQTVRAELFGPDGLHMNAAGYALWTSLVRTALGLRKELGK